MNEDLKNKLWDMLNAPYQENIETEESSIWSEYNEQQEIKKLYQTVVDALDEVADKQIDNLPLPHNWQLAGGQMKVDLIDFCGNDKTFMMAARVSLDQDLQDHKPYNDIKLARYLLKHGHTSPFEHGFITYRIEAPIFVARQIMRHRTFSYNEISRRYTDENINFYLPQELKKQDEKRLQCSTDEPADDQELLKLIEVQHQSALRLYNGLIAAGVAREQARGILPVNLMTSFYMSGNFHNWMKFIKLRTDSHAQYETRLIANAIRQSLTCLYPDTMSVYAELNK